MSQFSDFKSKMATPELGVSDPIFNQARTRDTPSQDSSNPPMMAYEARWQYMDHLAKGMSNFDMKSDRDRPGLFKE
jgi:hypothetical protein